MKKVVKKKESALDIVNYDTHELTGKDLFNLLFKESIGGNADKNKAVVNAIVNKKTGLILGFSNLPLNEYLSKKKINNKQDYTATPIVYDMAYMDFEAAIKNMNFYPKITKIIAKEMSANVKKKISTAVKKANKQYKAMYEKPIKEVYEQIYKKIKPLLEKSK